MQDNEQKLDRLLRDCGKRYRDVSFRSFQIGQDRNAPKRKAARDAVVGYLRSAQTTLLAGRNLVLYGTCGTGKDHLAISLAKACCQRGVSARFVTGQEFIAAADRNRRNGLEPVEASYKTCRVLVLSDPLPNATELRSDELRYMMQLVDARYRAELPTIVTANAESREDFETSLRGPLGDRLLGNAIVVEMRWSTFRKVQPEDQRGARI